MVACMFRICAAAATPCAWLPDENATTPPARASCGIDQSLLKAPRNLNDPVRCSISGFRKTRAPVRSSSAGEDRSGVRTAKRASTRAAASISAGLTVGIEAGSVIRVCIAYCDIPASGPSAGQDYQFRLPGRQFSVEAMKVMDRSVAETDPKPIGRADCGTDPRLGVAQGGFHFLALCKSGGNR